MLYAVETFLVGEYLEITELSDLFHFLFGYFVFLFILLFLGCFSAVYGLEFAILLYFVESLFKDGSVF